MKGLGSYPITIAGDDTQKLRYVAEAAAGRKIAAFAITEPDAGSDVASLRARARRDGDRYLLDGHKTLISNAPIADFLVVFARVEPAGITAFVVERGAPGLDTGGVQRLLGEHPIGEVALAGCPAARLGDEGQGLAIALATLDVFRATVGAAACGMAARALEESVLRVRGRVQFGRPLVEQQAVQLMLADMATELDGARLLVYRAAWLHDQGAPAKRAAAQAKLAATEAAQRVVDRALQLHGGVGLLAGSPTERLYRDVRALRIYEGTSEIQRIVIARDLVKAAKL
jgi:acyl-CoA dehydrogenase